MIDGAVQAQVLEGQRGGQRPVGASVGLAHLAGAGGPVGGARSERGEIRRAPQHRALRCLAGAVGVHALQREPIT